MPIYQTPNSTKCILRFGDVEQIMLDAMLTPYAFAGIGPEGLCEVCGAPLETVGDILDGICPLYALIPVEHRHLYWNW